MIRKYFLCFEYRGETKSGERYNKFNCGVYKFDLNDGVYNFCRDLIADANPDIDADSATIKVTALNNIR